MILAVDIDKTLTYESCFSREQVLNAKPNKKMIEWVNEMYYSGHAIILYTCRGDSVLPATRCWLKENGVKHHSLNNNKLWADWYIDDKAISPGNFIKYGKRFVKMAKETRDRDRAPKDKHGLL